MYSFRLPVFSFLFLLLAQQGLAQPSVSDSLVKTSLLYQKGKSNTRTGGILLGVGTVGTLIGLAMPEPKTTSGWRIGPTGRQMVFILAGTVGFIGILKLGQGSGRINKARAQVSSVLYWKAPGQQSSMPALTLHWQPGKGLRKDGAR